MMDRGWRKRWVGVCASPLRWGLESLVVQGLACHDVSPSVTTCRSSRNLGKMGPRIKEALRPSGKIHHVVLEAGKVGRADEVRCA